MSMATIRVTNGRVVTPRGIINGGVWAEDGVIGFVGDNRQLPAAEETVDARGRFVLPGLVDPHVHLGVGGSADDTKFLSDLATETRAAAVGGITTIVTDHENAHGPSWVTTRLGPDGRTLLEHAKAAIASRSPVDVRYTANPSNADDLHEMRTLVEQSVTSFKMFPSYVGAEAEEFGIETVDLAFIYEAFEAVARLDESWRPTQGMVHCEEPSICALLKARLRAGNAGSLKGWAQARPAICEAMQILDIGLIAKQTGARAYIPHVSSEEGVRAIEYLKQRDVRIIGETCPHYLVSRFPWDAGAFGKVNPPVHDGSDRDYLWAALADGRLEALGSDNCRFTPSEKSDSDLWDAIPGFSEIGLSLALMLTDGIAEGRLDWVTLARVSSEYPARLFGLYPAKGAIQSGADADLVVVDPKEEWTVRAHEFWYDVDSSLYEGASMRGRPVTTIRRGEVVAEKGWVASDGGRYVETPRATKM